MASTSTPPFSLPKGGLALSALDDQLLQPGTKGLALSEPLRQGAVAVQGWNVLRGDTSFPIAVLRTSALRHNLAWMKRFCARYGVQLAPHGKTTMCPQLFGAQLANGAWGLTFATANQVQLAHRFGVRRALLANQLAARADIAALLALLRDDPDFELVLLADSPAGVDLLAEAVRARPLGRPLPVLVELGIAGKRAGCRSHADALGLARVIAATPGLQLAGFEGYEGLLVSNDRQADVAAVNGFLETLCQLVRDADAAQLFGGAAIVLSAGGSSYFDLVARGFAAIGPTSRPIVPVLRSGCYLTSDHGLYRRLTAELNAREALTPDDGLRPALEVWSTVLSRPEPALAILSMGKRDASYDVELPLPLLWQRPSLAAAAAAPATLPPEATLIKMNDQHAYLRLPEDHPLAVGDLVGCGISHPCTTFDKWNVLYCVNDNYDLEQIVNTFF